MNAHRKTWQYKGARSRRILKGGCVMPVMLNYFSQGHTRIIDGWDRDSRHLFEWLRAARRFGWTLAELLNGGRFPGIAPYLPRTSEQEREVRDHMAMRREYQANRRRLAA